MSAWPSGAGTRRCRACTCAPPGAAPAGPKRGVLLRPPRCVAYSPPQRRQPRDPRVLLCQLRLRGWRGWRRKQPSIGTPHLLLHGGCLVAQPPHNVVHRCIDGVAVAAHHLGQLVHEVDCKGTEHQAAAGSGAPCDRFSSAPDQPSGLLQQGNARGVGSSSLLVASSILSRSWTPPTNEATLLCMTPLGERFTGNNG